MGNLPSILTIISKNAVLFYPPQDRLMPSTALIIEMNDYGSRLLRLLIPMLKFQVLDVLGEAGSDIALAGVVSLQPVEVLLLLAPVRGIHRHLLGVPAVVLLVQVVHHQQRLGGVGLVGDDVGGHEHADDDGRRDGVGLHLPLDVEPEDGDHARDEDVRADAVETHGGLVAVVQHAHVGHVLAVLRRLAVGVARQRHVRHRVGPHQVEETQAPLTVTLFVRGTVAAEQVQDQVGHEEEGVDEGRTDHRPQVLEDQQLESVSD
jgi:hypothetical protein